jgi:hypothetical protein
MTPVGLHVEEEHWGGMSDIGLLHNSNSHFSNSRTTSYHLYTVELCRQMFNGGWQVYRAVTTAGYICTFVHEICGPFKDYYRWFAQWMRDIIKRNFMLIKCKPCPLGTYFFNYKCHPCPAGW